MAVDAGSIYSEVRIRLDKLKGDIQQMNSLFDQVDQGTEKVEKSTESMGLVAVAAFAAVGFAIQKLVTGSIKLFADFEQSLANVASVAGATPEEFEKITESALEAGETTRFTASQAADALYYLASAGFDAAQSMGALEGVLNLAGATQSDLAFTSRAVASTISQFSLEAEDATKVANIFTAAITNSQATMDKLATSLRFVGPVASSFGLSLEEVTGGLQILFNAGFEASTAGTALRSALADLSNESGPAVAKLEKLGVAFSEIDPAANSFAEIIGVLSEKVSEGGDILNVFGDRAGPALIKLIQEGQESIEEYTAAVTDTNAAAEAYAIQNDTLAGSIDRLKSASEGARISFAELLAPAIRLVTDLLTKALNALAKLPTPLKILIGIIGIGVPAVIALTVAISALIPVLTAVGVTLAAVALPITAVVGGLAAIAAGTYAIKKAVDKSQLRQIKLEYGKLAEQIGVTTEEMRDLVKVQEQIGGTQTIEQLNNFRIALGLTTKDIKKLRGEAYSLGLSFESFVVATEALGLTRAEAKLLDVAFQLTEKDIISGSKNIAEFVSEIADKWSLTEEQVVSYALTNTKITGQFREQLQILRDQTVEERERAAIDAKDFAERKRIALVEEQLKLEREITTERVKQGLITQEDLDKIFIEARAQEDKAFSTSIRQAEALASAGLSTEKELLESKLKANENYLNALTGLQEGYITETSPLFQLTADEIKTLRAQLELLNSESDAADRYGQSLQNNIDKTNAARESTYQANLEQIEGIKNTQDSIEDLGKSELELIEIQRQRAIESVEASQADQVFKEAAIGALNEYYDALKDDSSNQKFLDNLINATEKVKEIFNDVVSAIETINENALEKQLELINTQLNAALEAAGVAEETKRESLERQLADAIATGDAENIKLAEDALTRYDITSDFERQKAQIQYEAELNSWRLKVASAVANAAAAVITNFAQLGWIGGAIANAAMAVPIGVEIAALANAKPVAPSFNTGGLVIPSGSSGGRSVNVAENGSSELLLNNSANGRAFLNEFADLISQRMGGGANGNLTILLNVDGRKIAETSATWYNNGLVRLDI